MTVLNVRFLARVRKASAAAFRCQLYAKKGLQEQPFPQKNLFAEVRQQPSCGGASQQFRQVPQTKAYQTQEPELEPEPEAFRKKTEPETL